ncbi:MAG: hypothetical protein J7L14_00740 [Candidatus Diapherotrites archaeon]|nr:hypothetical protein [Candidatus Diapherotrites archaeon]
MQTKLKNRKAIEFILVLLVFLVCAAVISVSWKPCNKENTNVAKNLLQEIDSINWRIEFLPEENTEMKLLNSKFVNSLNSDIEWINKRKKIFQNKKCVAKEEISKILALYIAADTVAQINREAYLILTLKKEELANISKAKEIIEGIDKRKINSEELADIEFEFNREIFIAELDNLLKEFGNYRLKKLEESTKMEKRIEEAKLIATAAKYAEIYGGEG